MSRDSETKVDPRIHYGSGLGQTLCFIKVVEDKVFETSTDYEVTCPSCKKELNKRKKVRVCRYVGG